MRANSGWYLKSFQKV